MARALRLAFVLLTCGITSMACMATGQTITDPEEAGPEFAIQGEYVGEAALDGDKKKYGAQIIAGRDGFQAVLYEGGLPGDGWERGDPRKQGRGTTADGTTMLRGPAWSAVIADGTLTLRNSAGDAVGELKKTERKSPTLGAKPPEGAIVLFDGSGPDADSTDAWRNAGTTGGPVLDASKFAPPGAITRQEFDDYTLHVEFRTPFMPAARGQARGNSGVYLNERYEIQVLDSFGLEGRDNECGGFYQASQPKVNMCLPPLAWQTYDIEFTSAKFDETGKKTSDAKVSVKHNGVPIHEDLTLPNITPGGARQEAPGRGPIFLQNHRDPVQFRNIWIVERK